VVRQTIQKMLTPEVGYEVAILTFTGSLISIPRQDTMKQEHLPFSE